MGNDVKTAVTVKFIFELEGKEQVSYSLTTNEGEDVEESVDIPGVGLVTISIEDDKETAEVIQAGSCQSVFCAGSRVSSYPQSLNKLAKHLSSTPEEYTVKAEAIPTPLPKRPKHPDGLLCGDCLLFDAPAGRDYLNQNSHTFAGGDNAQMHKDIVNAMATTYGRPTISEDLAGFCPKQRELCAKTAPACTEFEEK